MADEILFAGGGLETASLWSNAYASTDTGYYDTARSDHGVILDTSGGFFVEYDFRSGATMAPGSVVTGETLFVHAFVCSEEGAINGSLPFLLLKDTSDEQWFRLTSSSGQLQPQYNSGSGASPTWTDVGSSIAVAGSQKIPYDVEITLGSPHSFTVYKENIAVSSGTFTQADLTDLSRVRFANAHGSTGANIGTGISQVMVTRGISTVGAYVQQVKATADGANTGWTGAYTDVNETLLNDATVQAAGSAGLKETHVMADISVAVGFEIKGVFHWMRAKNDGSAPLNLKSVLRESGTDYSSSDLSLIDLGYYPIGARYDASPLGPNWTAANFNSLEIGFESAT